MGRRGEWELGREEGSSKREQRKSFERAWREREGGGSEVEREKEGYRERERERESMNELNTAESVQKEE